MTVITKENENDLKANYYLESIKTYKYAKILNDLGTFLPPKLLWVSKPE